MNTVYNHNMESIAQEQRSQYLAQKGEQLKELLRETFPGSEGYKHSDTVFRPFQEWPDMKGYAFGVRKGWFWGYNVSIGPADFQAREAKVEIKDNFAFHEALALIAVIAGLATSITLVVLVIINGTKDYRDYALAAFSGLIPGVGIYFLLKFLSKPVVNTHCDPQRIEKEKQELLGSINNMFT